MVEMFCKEKAWLALNLWSVIETDLWFSLSEKQFLSQKQSVYWKWSQPPPLYFPPFGPPPFLPQDLRDLSHYHHNLFLPSQALSQILQDLHILFLLSFFYLFQPSLKFYWIYTFLLSPFQPFLSSQNLWNISHYLFKPLIRYCRIFGIFLAITTIYIHHI